MNIALIKESIIQAREIKPIGKTVTIDGVACHVMGLLLQADGVLQLLILEYDDEYRNKREQAELDGLLDVYEKPATNRDEQRGAWRHEPRSRFLGTEKVFFGRQELPVAGSSGCICSTSQWEIVVLFTRFLVCGWDPSGIDIGNLDYMHLTRISFGGTYDSLPNFVSPTAIRFSMRPIIKSYLVEIPVTLEIGGGYNEKLIFSDGQMGQVRWLQINDVYLYDLWDHYDNLFADPRMKELVSEEELAKQKIRIAETFSDECPKGMRFIAVDYECDDDVSVQFFGKRWLDTAPRHNRNGAFGIIGKSDKPTGKLGMKLKTAFIQEPFSPDTTVVEAELFRCHIMTATGDITI